MDVAGVCEMKIIRNALTLTSRETEEWRQGFARLGNVEQVVFMDIETTGFSRMYDSVYLIGYLYYHDGRFYIEQHLAEGLGDELALLESYGELMEDYTLCVTFNGELFDFPFIEDRWKVLHIHSELPAPSSYDLLKKYRPYGKFFGWPNCRLKTIEAFLGIDREDEFDGGQLIEVFYEYARTMDLKLEKVLLLHNYEDLMNMPRLLRVESFVRNLREADVEAVRPDMESSDEIRFRVTFNTILPLTYEGCFPLCKKRSEQIGLRTEAGSPVIYMRVPRVQGELYYYLPNPRDYYYLPETDTILHKSLAGTMDTTGRKQATKKNCRLRQQGCFLVGASAVEGLHAFYEEPKSPIVYYEETELLRKLEEGNGAFLTAWVHSLLFV